MHTPWGKADNKEFITRGINFYSTASHGGYKVSDKLNLKIHEAFRNTNGWYEEDCEWAKVVVSFSLYFDKDLLVSAHKTLRNYFPDDYEVVYNVKVHPEDSVKRRQQMFDEATKDKYVVTAAWGSWEKGVPEGKVKVLAKKGASRKYFLVDAEDYKKRDNRFVIDESKHEEVL